MKDLRGKTAVVTGGASGIGKGLAVRFKAEGMNVVIADIEQDALRQTAAEIGAHGIRTDVSDLSSVQALAAGAVAKYGSVDVVCNNAGIGGFSKVKDLTVADWQWMLGVNLWSVIHGLQVFLPMLLKNPDGGWIVNTASMGGVSTFPTLGAYATAKFGVTALTETLALELEQDGGKVGATLLLPGPIRSNLGKSVRNRPAGLASGSLADLDLENLPQYKDKIPWRDAAHAADVLVSAIHEGRLYAVTHPEQSERVEKRSSRLLEAFGKRIEIFTR